MEAITAIVTALALGAAAGLKGSTEQRIKEEYTTLKALLKSKCPQANSSIDKLEHAPDSKARRVVVEEDLTKEGADHSAQILEQAKALLDVIVQRAPNTADALGVSLRDITGASIRIADVLSSGSGVSIEGVDIGGDITIQDVRAGQQGGNYPNRVTAASEEGDAAASVSLTAVSAGRDVYIKVSTTQDEQFRRNRRQMLEKVRFIWIKGFLEESLYHLTRIELDLETKPDAIERSFDLSIQRPAQGPQPLPTGTPIIHCFDEAGHALLILGKPGAGKTTLLLELTQDLLDRAVQDESHLIPVVFNLSSWAEQRLALDDWLIDELNKRYDVPHRLAKAWVDADLILPLLDGLDEVADYRREACITTINAFLSKHSLLPIVVCSRTAEYEMVGTRLRLNWAVVIQSLTHTQIDAYLACNRTYLASVSQILHNDSTLWELLDTPLALSILILSSITGASATEAITHRRTLSKTVERWPSRFAAYVDHMLWRRSKEEQQGKTVERKLHLFAAYVDHMLGHCSKEEQPTLDLSGIGLMSLSESIGKLTQLITLNLSNNRLSSLPKSIVALSQLHHLYLHGNEQLGIPPEILGPTAQEVNRYQKEPTKPTDILNYYFRIQGEPRTLNEAKLILVGYGSVGKTSLVNRLVHNHFNSSEKQTEGIKITQWFPRLNGYEDVRINIWDFGGQEIMHSTHQFFLTKRSLYLLVLNGRQGHEDADAEYWLSLIESFGEDSPVIVVLNKINEYTFDVNRRALKQKFPSIRDIIETDCADRTGINDLRQAIERETNRLEHLRDAFPTSWFAIKEQLASMSADYLMFEQYRDICAKHDEKDPQRQVQLASYLHMLGIALNYREDRRLRDTHVLNPRWITNGIYTILNAEHLARQKGELHIDELSDILDPVAYPPERYGFLLDLMHKFELSFSFPEEDERYLVTGLLDKQQPPEADAFSPEACLNFEYHYPLTLPEGLLPRFIVRTNVLSRDQPRWRIGVILQFEDNQALVHADMQAKKVVIRVRGPVSSRRRLLAVIRSDFEHIHQSFKFNPQEMIPVSGHPELVVPYEKLVVLEFEGVSSFLEVASRKAIALDVQELLNGVDLEGTRSLRQGTDGTRGALKLFYSYAHKDEHLRDELETHLKILHRQGLIESWYDRKIGPGEHWKEEIDMNIETADVILLLVSADFIASNYCYEVEMTRAMERYAGGKAQVVPIIVRDVNWCKPPLNQFQALPKNGQAITTWQNRDTAWRDVSEGIEKVVQELLKNRKR
jgi:internalin A